MTPDAAALRDAVVALLGDRDEDKTICPSEVARHLGGDTWRDLMDPVRSAAAELAVLGVVEIVQAGAPVDMRSARGPVRIRRGPDWTTRSPLARVTNSDVAVDSPNDTATTHWLLPVNPAAHVEYLPGDWRTRPDATAVWSAIGRSQPVQRWCLRTGFRTMAPGDVIWAYLSVRQEVCAVGTVRDVVQEGDAGLTDESAPIRAQRRPEGAGGRAAGWFVFVDWDADRTMRLCRDPLPRAAFGQVPMSTCRAGHHTASVLSERYDALYPR